MAHKKTLRFVWLRLDFLRTKDHHNCCMKSSVGNGDVEPELSRFEALLHMLSALSSHFEICRSASQDDIVSFYLDGSGIPEWRAMIIIGGERKLFLEPGFCIEPFHD